MDGYSPMIPPLGWWKNPSPFPSTVPSIHHIPQDDSTSVPPNAWILSHMHENFDALLHSKNILEASTSMSHSFEIYRSIPLPKIVTNLLIKCGCTHGAFFSTHIWDMNLSVNLYISPLTPTPNQGFSNLLTLMIDPYHGPMLATHQILPAKVFT